MFIKRTLDRPVIETRPVIATGRDSGVTQHISLSSRRSRNLSLLLCLLMAPVVFFGFLALGAHLAQPDTLAPSEKIIEGLQLERLASAEYPVSFDLPSVDVEDQDLVYALTLQELTGYLPDQLRSLLFDYNYKLAIGCPENRAFFEDSDGFCFNEHDLDRYKKEGLRAAAVHTSGESPTIYFSRGLLAQHLKGDANAYATLIHELGHAVARTQLWHECGLNAKQIDRFVSNFDNNEFSDHEEFADGLELYFVPESLDDQFYREGTPLTDSERAIIEAYLENPCETASRLTGVEALTGDVIADLSNADHIHFHSHEGHTH